MSLDTETRNAERAGDGARRLRLLQRAGKGHASGPLQDHPLHWVSVPVHGSASMVAWVLVRDLTLFVSEVPTVQMQIITRLQRGCDPSTVEVHMEAGMLRVSWKELSDEAYAELFAKRGYRF